MCMWDGYDDYPSVHRGKDVVARKEHRCCECGRKIGIGECYHYAFQIYDGDPYQFHTCAHCLVAQAWLKRECGGFLIEGTWEDIAKHISEYPSLLFPLGRLMVGYRKKWLGMPIPAVPSASAEEYVK